VTEEQMRAMVKEIRRLEKILGDGVMGVNPAQATTQAFRRVVSRKS